jgi:hypothetical protein
MPTMRSRRLTLLLLASLSSLGSTGCVTIGYPVTPTPDDCVTSSTQTASVPVLFTSDAGLGPLLGFQLGVASVTLTDRCGNTVPVYTRNAALAAQGASTIELTHVNGISEPLTIASLPVATYTSASVSYDQIDINYLYPSNTSYQASDQSLPPRTSSATLRTPISIATSSSSLVLDVLVSGPIVLGPGLVNLTPKFTLSSLTTQPNPTNDRNGKATFRGLVSSVSSNGFTIGNSNDVPFDVTISNVTLFQGIPDLAALPVNEPASVDVEFQPDGTLRATRVEVENTDTVGSWVGPLVLNDPSAGYAYIDPRLWEEANDPFGDVISAGNPWHFQFTPATLYQRSGAPIDLADLPFTPAFGSFSDLALGQSLSVDWHTLQQFATSPETPALTSVLVPRTLSGTVTAMTPANDYTAYTLTLAPNDFMQTLNGTGSIAAYTNAGTQMEDGPLALGDLVNMHGLVYSDQGTLRLVADQVRLQQTPN